jgi:hypothetical protein
MFFFFFLDLKSGILLKEIKKQTQSSPSVGLVDIRVEVNFSHLNFGRIDTLFMPVIRTGVLLLLLLEVNFHRGKKKKDPEQKTSLKHQIELNPSKSPPCLRSPQ